MEILFVLALITFALAIIAVRTATDFLAWAILRIKTKVDESKKEEVKEEMEPL